MKNIAKIIGDLRKEKGWSQTELANKIGLSYPQMSRYEVKGTQPPADTLKKLADVLGTTVDFLINGATDEKAKANLKDSDLLNQFKAVDANFLADLVFLESRRFVVRTSLNIQ